MAVDQKFTYIQSINPGMKSINIQFIVLEIGAPKHTKDGQDVRRVRVADASGSVDLAVWNELGEAINPGDICRLKNGYSVVRKGCLSVSCGKSGELLKIGEFTMVFSETPNVSEFNPNHAESVNQRKRSPPAGDEDSAANGGGEGPPHKSRKHRGHSGSSGQSSGRNGGFGNGSGSREAKDRPQPSTSTSANSVPDSPETSVSKAGYRRMAPSKAKTTHTKHQHNATVTQQNVISPQYSSFETTSAVVSAKTVPSPPVVDFAVRSSSFTREAPRFPVPLMNSVVPQAGVPPMNFFQRFPPPPFLPNMNGYCRPRAGFLAQKIG